MKTADPKDRYSINITVDGTSKHAIAHIYIDLGRCTRMKDVDIALQETLTDPELLPTIKAAIYDNED